MILIYIIIIIPVFVGWLLPFYALAFGTYTYKECNVQRHERRFPPTRLALSFPNPFQSNSRKLTTFCTMTLSNDNAISSFPANLRIPFSPKDEFFNHTKFNEAMQEKCGCTLSYCSIKIGSSLDELAHGEIVDAESDPFLEYDSMEDIEPFRERLIDLSFLDDLRIENSDEYENVEDAGSNDEVGSASSEESTAIEELEDIPQPSGEEIANDGTESMVECDEPFLPNRIYVRNNMRKIFGLFLNDVGMVKPEKRPTALIGSPGVGKSILFFLAAIYRCSQKAEKEVIVDGKKKKVRVVNTSIYYRWAGSEEKISVFIMFRDNNQEDGEHKVHVLFNRTLDYRRCTVSDGGLAGLALLIQYQLNIQRRHYFTFIDGPNYSEKHKTMDGEYDYFCTSGGIPTFKGGQFNFRRWILNGWTKDESLQALITLHVRQDTPPADGTARTKEDPASEMDDELEDVLEKAHRAYWLCGGRIRDLRQAYDDYKEVKARIETSLAGIQTEDRKLAGDETVPIEGEQLDRMRTMFRAKSIGSDEVMGSFFGVVSLR
jgi:hypothetical protein